VPAVCGRRFLIPLSSACVRFSAYGSPMIYLARLAAVPVVQRDGKRARRDLAPVVAQQRTRPAGRSRRTRAGATARPAAPRARTWWDRGRRARPRVCERRCGGRGTARHRRGWRARPRAESPGVLRGRAARPPAALRAHTRLRTRRAIHRSQRARLSTRRVFRLRRQEVLPPKKNISFGVKEGLKILEQ
jgi:hypothetical protein